MKIIGLISIFLILSKIHSFGQTSQAKYYCQGCCSSIGEYYLKLHTDSEFELYYGTKEAGKEKSTFGFGKFNVNNDTLSLVFDNIPEEKVEVKKINTSDSLIIYFSMYDNIRGDSSYSLIVYLINRLVAK